MTCVLTPSPPLVPSLPGPRQGTNPPTTALSFLKQHPWVTGLPQHLPAESLPVELKTGSSECGEGGWEPGLSAQPSS